MVANGKINDDTKKELDKLYKHIKKIEKLAEETNEPDKKILYNSKIYFTFEGKKEGKKGRTVSNCAEIWAARNAILQGAKFDNLIFRSQTYVENKFADPCQNCRRTFAYNWVLSDDEIYMPSKKFQIDIPFEGGD